MRRSFQRSDVKRQLARTLPMSEWRRAQRWLGTSRKKLFLAAALALCVTGTETALLFTVAKTIESLVGDDETGWLAGANAIRNVASLGLLAALGACLARVSEAWVSAGLASTAVRNAADALLATDLNQPWQLRQLRRHGMLQQMIATNAQKAAVPVQFVTAAITAISSLFVYLVVIVWMAPGMLLAGAAIGILLTIGFRPVRTRARAAARSNATAITDLQLDASTVSGVHRELWMMNVTSIAVEKLASSTAEVYGSMRKVRFYSRATAPLYQIAVLVALLTAILIASATDYDTAGVAPAALLLIRSLSYIQLLNSSVQAAIEAGPLLEDLDRYIGDVGGVRRDGTESVSGVTSIALRNVSFAYSDGDTVLSDVSLQITAGERVAIVGRSGGGKSTLALLLTGLIEPSDGTVTINDVPMTNIGRASLAREIGYVPQETALIRDSIAENVSLYRGCEGTAVANALEQASLCADLSTFADGIDTLVGDGYGSLSGGQRQRLGIARAIAGRPSLLVLDEPSSALDDRLEEELLRSIQRLDASTTVVIVTHRPRLLEACERIIRIDAGRITEDYNRHQESPSSA